MAICLQKYLDCFDSLAPSKRNVHYYRLSFTQYGSYEWSSLLVYSKEDGSVPLFAYMIWIIWIVQPLAKRTIQYSIFCIYDHVNGQMVHIIKMNRPVAKRLSDPVWQFFANESEQSNGGAEGILNYENSSHRQISHLPSFLKRPQRSRACRGPCHGSPSEGGGGC